MRCYRLMELFTNNNNLLLGIIQAIQQVVHHAVQQETPASQTKPQSLKRRDCEYLSSSI